MPDLDSGVYQAKRYTREICLPPMFCLSFVVQNAAFLCPGKASKCPLKHHTGLQTQVLGPPGVLWSAAAAHLGFLH